MTTYSEPILAKRLRQLICLIYTVGGVMGLYVLLPQLSAFTRSWLTITLYGLLVFQNLVALAGSWLFWQKKVLGGQWLYWLSWSSVPVFSSAMLSYHSIIGLGIVPLLRLEPGHYGTDIMFSIGYDWTLRWFPTLDMFQIGFNAVPLLFILIIRQLLVASER